MKAALKKARALVAGGWSEPYSTNNRGDFCLPTSEGVRNFSVDDAICLHCPNPSAALELLQAQVSPMLTRGEKLLVEQGIAAAWPSLLASARAGESYLWNWLRAPGRQLLEVLRVFDKAILKANP